MQSVDQWALWSDEKRRLDVSDVDGTVVLYPSVDAAMANSYVTAFGDFRPVRVRVEVLSE